MTVESPFASVASTLVANGFSAIPIKPAEKMPGVYKGGEWYVMRDWSRFCSKLPTHFELKLWSQWPDANVGIACGKGLLAFDIDRDDLIEPIKAVLPPCVVGKRGRKGETLFYRGDANTIRSRGFKIDNLGCMDLISDGKQTVIPPSIHRDTGAPYVWTTPRTLLDTRPEELPEIDESHVEAVIAVLMAFGYRADDQSRYIRAEKAAGIELEDGASAAAEFFRTLNEDALANLHAWVPRIGLQRLSKQGDHYRSVAEWRPSNSGNPLYKRPLLLSIHPKGIVDYGDGEKTYTPLNLVMAAHDLAEYQLDKAAVWLGEAIGYDFSPKIVLNRNRTPVAMSTPGHAARIAGDALEDAEPDSDGSGYSEAFFAEMDTLKAVPGDVEARTANVVDIPTAFDPTTGEVFAAVALEEVDASGMTPESYMESLTRVPGLVGDIVDWIERTSATPNRTLAFAATIAFIGTLAGRNYKSGTNLRTNLYTLGLAPSGFGKDHALTCIEAIVEKATLGEWLAGSDIASGSGMRKRVEHHPAIMWIIDEFGGFLRKIADPRNAHACEIRDNLLKYFEKAGGQFRGTDYAAERGNICHQPNVSITGASTPSDFWNACRSNLVTDGLLPRFLVFSVGEQLTPSRLPRAARDDVPRSLADACRLLTIPKLGGNMTGRLSDGSTPANPLPVAWGAGAEADFYRAKERYRVAAYEHTGMPEASIFGRVAEHAQKIALILAIGVDARRPILTADLFARGMAIAAHCARTVIEQISGRMADNDKQREHIDVKRWIVEAGAAGISKTELSRRINGRFDARRRDDILNTLENDERTIESRLFQSPRGGPKGSRYFAAQRLAEAG